MAKMRNLDISNTRVERTVDLSEVFSERINWVIGNENEKKKKKKKKQKKKPAFLFDCGQSSQNMS